MAVGKWIGRGVLVLLGIVVLAIVGAFLLLDWADLRTAETEAGDPAASEARGRELLRRAEEVHGAAAIEGHRTMTIVAVDEWASDSNWWNQTRQRYRVERILGTFTSRLERLDGEHAGEVWGIQNWRPYKAAPNAPSEWLESDDAIEFYLPTLQYFDELAFRLADAEIVRWAGSAEEAGRRYERVFVTWGDVAPHSEHDQYDVWLDADSGRIEKVAYTVRDAVPISPFWQRPLIKAFGVGTMHFEDYRTVGGVLFPFRQTVTLGGAGRAQKPLDENFMHRIVVEEVAFDRVEERDLLPDPQIGAGSDSKPKGIDG